jgi:hypothetical protein
MIDAGRSAFCYKPDEICSLRAFLVVTRLGHWAASFAVLHNAEFPTHFVVGCNPRIEGSI